MRTIINYNIYGLLSSNNYLVKRFLATPSGDAGHGTTGSGAVSLIMDPWLMCMRCWYISWILPVMASEFAGLPYCSAKPSLWFTKA